MQTQFLPTQEILIQLPEGPEDQRFTSRILEVSEGMELSISAPAGKDGAEANLPIATGSTLILEVPRPDGIRRFSAAVRKRLPGSPAMLVMEWPQDVERIQRRNDVRVDIAVPVELEPLQRMPGVPRRIDTKTMDLSAGGLRAVVQDRLPSNLPVRIRLKLDSGLLLVEGIVLRVHSIDQAVDGQKFWAAIQFTTVNQRDRQEIARAVFNIQREQLRKGVL